MTDAPESRTVKNPPSCSNICESGRNDRRRCWGPIGKICVAAIAFDSTGNYFIADEFNLRIRKVSSGTITTIAGKSHFAGDGGPAGSALIHLPDDVVVDGSGNILLSDNDNHRIRKVTPGGTISTVVGTGVCGYSGDGAVATAAAICYPSQMAFDKAGNLLFADSGNSVIRKQVQSMVTRLLELKSVPEPPDVADALAIAICHIHTAATLKKQKATARS